MPEGDYLEALALQLVVQGTNDTPPDMGIIVDFLRRAIEGPEAVVTLSR
jgi:hypothetical protein